MPFDMNSTKTENAISYLREGLYKECFDIVSNFKLGFNKKEIRVIQIARDCLKGNDMFYTQLGIDTEEIQEMAKRILLEKYKITNKT